MGLNPFSWFGGEVDEEALILNIATPAEEATASSLLAEGIAALEAGQNGRAASRFKRIVKKYPTTKAVAEARFRYAQILMARTKWTKAFEQLQNIVTENPDYPNFNRVIAAQFDCGTALMEGARGRILWVIPGFRQYEEAITQFEMIVRNAPYSDYAPLSLMNIALVAQIKEEPDIAIDALDRLINFYPQSMLAPDAYFNMAETYADLVKGPAYDQGSTRQAISYYEDFLILFPQSSNLGEVEGNLRSMENLLASSRLNLGNFYYFYRSNNTAALTFYNEAITIAPDSEAADEARARIEDVEAGVRPVSGASFIRKILFID
jgi:outer membrane protein assembly factor BamD